jgi:hypothetical protein
MPTSSIDCRVVVNNKAKRVTDHTQQKLQI